MVYTELQLVLGIKVTDREACEKILKKNEEEFEEAKKKHNLTWVFTNVIDLEDDLEAFPPMCCRDSTDIVIGQIIRKIPRKKSRCENCPYERRNCDRCFGQTVDGFYDFHALFDPLVECQFENICWRCGFDNSIRIQPKKICLLWLLICRKVGIPKDVGLMVCGYLSKITERKVCERCNYPFMPRENISAMQNLARTFKDRIQYYYDIDGDCKVYYVYNDCASCT